MSDKVDQKGGGGHDWVRCRHAAGSSPEQAAAHMTADKPRQLLQLQSTLPWYTLCDIAGE